MVESFLSNPYISLVLAICTLLSFVFAVWSGLKNRERKEFSCLRSQYQITRTGQSTIPGLELSYMGKPIDDLTISKIAIWNSGNRLLHATDIVSLQPLSIHCPNGEILSAKIVKHSEKANQFEIKERAEKKLVLGFDYADSRDGVVVQVLHTGSNALIGLEGKIKGGKKIRYVPLQSVFSQKRSWKAMLLSLAIIIVAMIAVAIVAALALAGILPIQQVAQFIAMPTDPYELCTLVIVASVILAPIYSWVLWRELKTSLFMAVPSKLRESMEIAE